MATASSPHASLESIKHSQLGVHLRSIREAINVSRGTPPIAWDMSCGSTGATSAGVKTRRQGRLQANTPPSTNAPNTSRSGLRCAIGRTIAVKASAAIRALRARAATASDTDRTVMRLQPMGSHTLVRQRRTPAWRAKACRHAGFRSSCRTVRGTGRRSADEM